VERELEKLNKSDSTESGKHFSQRGSSRFYFISFMLMLAVGYGVFYWQSSIVSSKDGSILSLNKQTNKLTASNGSLQHANGSLKSQVGKLNNQLQNVLANEKTPEPTPTVTPSATPKPVTATSELIINDEKQVPASTYWTQAPSGTIWNEIDFTIYNNSDKTETYNISDPEGGAINGVNVSGELIRPQIPMGNEYLQSTLLPGGSADGYALFQPSDGVVKLQWTPSDSSSPIYVALP
jgi:hypothetical protein